MNFLACSIFFVLALTPRPAEMPAAISRSSALSLAGNGNVAMSVRVLRRVEVAGQRAGHLDRHARLAVGDHLGLLLERRPVRVRVEVAALLELEVALVDRRPSRSS